MAKIVFVQLEPWEKELVKKKLKGHKLIFTDKKIQETPISKIKDADIIAPFVYSEITEQFLKKCKKVKLITTMTTGYDHIDLKACKKRNIIVCNVPAYGDNTVAEHAMALLLAVSRKIVQSVEKTRRCDFSYDDLRGFDLQGKTIGIIGLGKIGKHMAKYASAFGMKVIANSRKSDKAYLKQNKIKNVNLDTLLKQSDVISIHVPETPETHHLINKKNITKIKKGCVLINTARGGIVETEALLIGLNKGILAGCGLDVLEGECEIKEEKELLIGEKGKKCDLKILLQDHLLLEHENVLITPHNAFNTKEALHRIINTTIDNINAFLKGKSQNVVK
ncbi:hydroxyacid dehydrogenase [Candidatus Woesearchaeota archaeon CG10_big_fil_rev_8_21_14_0_10_37_12]|nr:MAG: hydroxyacid dehydrogenase [Candidatus Woesearchaeota archaeon CG10_big_fil_rev_8_21_14_0_10_37_12]